MPLKFNLFPSVAPTVDLVLLTHAAIAHLGALPYLIGQGDLKAPVYCTAPVQKMGQMLMLDHWFSKKADEKFTVYSMDDVISAFRDAANTLKYNQPRMLPDALKGITITPHPAGHSLGGTMWVVRIGGEEIVYAPLYNNRKERLTNGATLEGLFVRPAALLTHTAWYLTPPPGGRDSREKQLTDTILAAVRADGNVLLPVDSSARVLELVLLLENFWHDNRLVYPLVLLTKLSEHTLELAGSQLQWCSDQLCRSFEQHLDNPFDYTSERDRKDRRRYLQRMHDLSELVQLPPGPKVVLASPPSLLCGASQKLLLQWGGDERSAVILTHTTQGELTERLLSHAKAGSRQPLELDIEVKRKVLLQGDELQEYLAAQNAEGGGDDMEVDETGGADGDAKLEVAGNGAPDSGGGQGHKGGGVQEAKILRANSAAISRLVKDGSGALVQQLQAEGAAAALPRQQVLLDGFMLPKGAQHAMFPDEEEDPITADTWTPYGLKMDFSSFAGVDEGLAEGQVKREEVQEVEEEEEVIPGSPPSRTEAETRHFTLRAQVRYFDFEGRADGTSLRTITTTVAPRNLVLLGGSSKAAAAFEAACMKQLSKYCTNTFTSECDKKVELTLGPVRGVELQEQLLEALPMHPIQGHRMAWMDARVTKVAEQGVLPELGPRQGDGPSTLHGGVFLSDVKLNEVARLLSNRGLDCSFAGAAALSCRGGLVLIRKEEGGQLAVEGALCDEYFLVRDVLYGQYRIC